MLEKYRMILFVMILFFGVNIHAEAKDTSSDASYMAPIISYLLSSSESILDSKTLAIDKIKAYADDQLNDIPTLDDYVAAGTEGVTQENLDAVNSHISELASNEVDTTIEIQEAVNYVLFRGTTVEDINLIVTVKEEVSSQTNFNTDDLPTAKIAPEHGIVEYYKIGNEVPAFTYTSTDCFIGLDTFFYQSGVDTGKVSLTINRPSTIETPNFIKTLFNTETITGEVLIPNNPSIEISREAEYGIVEITNPSGELVLYNYDPNNDYNGTDYFEYTVTETINGCIYTSTGRVTFMIEVEKEPLHLFNWDDGIHGNEPWITDGTVENTRILKDINHDSNSSWRSGNVQLNGITYFVATSTSSSYYDRELWRTDGTTEGTFMVVNLAEEEGHGSWPSNISVMGNNIYFMALTGDTSDSNNFSGDVGLWRATGSIDNATLIQNFGNPSGISGPGYLHALDDRLILQKDYQSGNGPEWNPWVSDGQNYVERLKGSTFEGSVLGGFMGTVKFNGSYYGSARDIDYGNELWKTDGTDNGTVLITDIVRGEDDYGRGRGSGITNLTVAGSKLFFTAFNSTSIDDDIEYDRSLWVTDGTSTGTHMIKDDDAAPSTYRDRFSNMTAMDGNLYFAYTNVDEYGNTSGLGTLWKSDGTQSGTSLLKDLNIDSYGMIASEDTIYFWVDSTLWKSDGTQIGTIEVKNFPSSYLNYIASNNELIYFEMYNTNPSQNEFWVSDGTEEGTIMLLKTSVQGEEW